MKKKIALAVVVIYIIATIIWTDTVAYATGATLGMIFNVLFYVVFYGWIIWIPALVVYMVIRFRRRRARRRTIAAEATASEQDNTERFD